jgi:hypothetical protein
MSVNRTRTAHRVAALAVIGLALAIASACSRAGDPIEEEEDYLQTVTIAGFQRTASSVTKNVFAFYVGPALIDVNTDIFGSGLILSTPKVGSFDRRFEALVDGDGIAADGTPCTLLVSKAIAGGPPPAEWKLTADQANGVTDRSLIVLRVAVLCGGG